jgi:hypothetical protein
VADDDYRLVRMAGDQFIYKGEETCLNVDQGLATREADLDWSRPPEGIELGMSSGGLHMGQALEEAIVNVEQAFVGLSRQGSYGGQRRDRLSCTKEGTGVEGR